MANPSNGEDVKEVAEKLKTTSVGEEEKNKPAATGGTQTKSRNNSQSHNKNRQRRRTSGAAEETAREGGGGEKKNNNKNRQNSNRRDSQSVSQTRQSKSSEGDKRRTRSTNSNNAGGSTGGGGGGGNKSRQSKASTRTMSQNSNGDGYYCSDAYDDLEEPFSDTDDETVRRRQPEKPNLFIPRGRIRTLSGTVPVTGYSPKWGGPTMCLSCLQFFDLPDQVENFTEHLLKEHKIVVQEMNLIVDPKRYIEHWRQRFAKESVDKIFPRIEPGEKDPYHGTTDYYYEMSEKLPEDYLLRQRLAMRRLEEALSCQQRERDDTNFSQQCIFCRYTAKGNRSKIIHHLYMIHHLNLGSPDNLVFVNEYIAHLKEKLDRQECIYCEKTFADRNTLMDHMRKRNHREVNPKNHYYDKFYIINYLELGKRWLDVLGEDFEDTTTAFQESDEELEEESWCEWQEDNVDLDETRVVCLLCDESTERGDLLIEHMQEKHGFDLLKLIKDNKLDTYERMKLINYVRKQNFNAICWRCGKSDNGNLIGLYKHMEEVEKPIKELPDRSRWDLDEFLVPIFGNDHFLWMLEGLLEDKEEKGQTSDDEELDRTDRKKFLESLVKKSQRNTVASVIAEDLPTLEEVPDLEELL
ncbi:unnamed protein product, partial [Mesorhabditis belari]|uniref:C2H2-type domain-containing protein n=1 Tax=Mesorhabditis belari TaxID=2138241 RepID=A0AAF3ETK9_9BILA